MKKILLLILSLCFIFALVSCGEEEAPAPEQAPEEKPAEVQVEPEALPEEKPAETTSGGQPASQRDKEIDDAIKSGKLDELPETDEPENKVAKEDPNKIAVGSDTYASVSEYVTKRGQEIISDYAANFGSGNCKCSIAASGDTIVIKNCHIGMNNLSDTFKKSMQSTYDSLGTSLKAVFQPLKKECPSLRAVIVEHCEANGTPYATVNVELD